MKPNPVKRKQKELFPHKVVGKTEIVPGVFDLRINRDFDFLPGQVVAVALSAEAEPRLYSIASATTEPYFRLLFDVNPQGLLTPELATLNTGDTLQVSAPFGRFTATHDPAWWIATGTGIAPFISMAESGYHDNKTLLHGARTPAEFYFADLFQQKLAANYHRFATREEGPGIHQGRLTNYLKSLNELPTDIKYYLCGNANMVVQVRDILLGKNVPFENIVAEIYF
jgi:ferredoxin-NADP reductase